MSNRNFLPFLLVALVAACSSPPRLSLHDAGGAPDGQDVSRVEDAAETDRDASGPNAPDSGSPDVSGSDDAMADGGGSTMPAHWHAVDGFDSAAIQRAFDAALPGEAVYFPSGTYVLTEPLPLKTGVALLGDPDSPALLEPSGEEPITTEVDGVSDVLVRDLVFRNMRLRFNGAADYSTGNIVFRDTRFFDASVAGEWNGHYLLFHVVAGVVVDRSTFERDRLAVGGRGVLLSRCHHCVVTDSFFGTNRDLDQGLGYFKTAINVYGYQSPTVRNIDTKVTRTVMRREEIDCPLTPTGEPGDVCQDHGLYAWGNRDLQVVGNRVEGWEPNSSGNSLKLRNGELMFVERNHFRDSGMFMFTYEREPELSHFEQAVVRRNRFDLGNPAATTASDSGLAYWRNFAAPGASGYESGIYLLDNRFSSGGKIRISSALATNFCVEGNDVQMSVTNSSGTPSTSGCRVPETWDRPFLGVLRGDFNNDGVEDLVHHFMEGGDGPEWLLHLSDGADAVKLERWPASTYADPDTELYGVHVGDFDGDGFVDDLVHWGRVGGAGTPAWRMYASNGSAFPVVNFASALHANAETTLYGVHVGDFDGDGRDDLVYRGSCASGSCWRVQRSNGSQFVAEEWGDSFYESEETEVYGILVGDYNGDGRDDLAYRGRCGTGDACWRVQRSAGDTFSEAANFGNSPYFTSDSAHYGLKVGDLNGDGLSDIGYMAACGDGLRRWRYQVSNGTTFSVECDPTFKF